MSNHHCDVVDGLYLSPSRVLSLSLSVARSLSLSLSLPVSVTLQVMRTLLTVHDF
jgi:hypothetical protein